MEELPHLVAGRGSGIAVVTDAMGSGKSVTALEMARIFNEHCGTQGVMWLLPSTAAADQAYEVLDRYVRAHRPEYAPVTLVHHHSDLNEAYTHRRLSPEDTSVLDGPPDDPFVDDQDSLFADDETECGPGAAGPDRWLRGRDNALLAQYTVSTTDQAQMAALPVRHSALRMLAISGKTVVVDEAHALEPFSQLQLLRLLNWLGALNSPVVLLSATMPASTTTELVRAYLSSRRPDRTPQWFVRPWLSGVAVRGRGHCHRSPHVRTGPGPAAGSSAQDRPHPHPARHLPAPRTGRPQHRGRGAFGRDRRRPPAGDPRRRMRGGGMRDRRRRAGNLRVPAPHMDRPAPRPGPRPFPGGGAATAEHSGRPPPRAGARRSAPGPTRLRHHQPPRHEPGHRRRPDGQRSRFSGTAAAASGPPGPLCPPTDRKGPPASLVGP